VIASGARECNTGRARDGKKVSAGSVTPVLWKKSVRGWATTKVMLSKPRDKAAEPTRKVKDGGPQATVNNANPRVWSRNSDHCCNSDH
jgi:hypothetical protein